MHQQHQPAPASTDSSIDSAQELVLTELFFTPPRCRAASPPKDNDKKGKTANKKDEGKWEMLTDVYGRAYW